MICSHVWYELQMRIGLHIRQGDRERSEPEDDHDT